MASDNHSKQLDRAMQGLATIKENRIQVLDKIAKQIILQHRKNGKVQLIFIGTHNSIRSLIAEALLSMSFAHFNIKSIEVTSAGVEKNLIPPQMMNMFAAEGYDCTLEDGKLFINNEDQNLILFSKALDQIVELDNSIAVMVCDQADQKYPFINGVNARFSLTYMNPSDHEDLLLEAKAYRTCFRKMLTEISYLALMLDEQL